MNISYTRIGDYLIPNLVLKNKKQYNFGKYELLKLEYLKKYKRELYIKLLMNDELNEFIHNNCTNLMEMEQKLIKELAEKENINEKLKSKDQMLYVRTMNNIQNRVEEIILKEYIYV